jgi:hypothetical protein
MGCSALHPPHAPKPWLRRCAEHGVRVWGGRKRLVPLARMSPGVLLQALPTGLYGVIQVQLQLAVVRPGVGSGPAGQTGLAPFEPELHGVSWHNL